MFFLLLLTCQLFCNPIKAFFCEERINKVWKLPSGLGIADFLEILKKKRTFSFILTSTNNTNVVF